MTGNVGPLGEQRSHETFSHHGLERTRNPGLVWCVRLTEFGKLNSVFRGWVWGGKRSVALRM